jgi:hypothetical protein
MIPTPEAFTEVGSLSLNDSQIEMVGNDGQLISIPITKESPF